MAEEPLGTPDEASGDAQPPPPKTVGKPSWMQGVIRQTWINSRAWVPFLMNPFERTRLVRYSAMDNRTGLTWNVTLPHMCWFCASDDQLSPRPLKVSVRSFEYPLQVLEGTLAAMFLIVLANCLLGIWWTLILLATAPLVGATILLVKSWPEPVRLNAWACPAHADETINPELVAYNDELYVYVLEPAIAEAATEQLQAERRGSRRRAFDKVSSGGPAKTDSTPPMFRPTAAQSPPPPPVDLPPIKLHDDNDPLG